MSKMFFMAVIGFVAGCGARSALETDDAGQADGGVQVDAVDESALADGGADAGDVVQECVPAAHGTLTVRVIHIARPCPFVAMSTVGVPLLQVELTADDEEDLTLEQFPVGFQDADLGEFSPNSLRNIRAVDEERRIVGSTLPAVEGLEPPYHANLLLNLRILAGTTRGITILGDATNFVDGGESGSAVWVTVADVEHNPIVVRGDESSRCGLFAKRRFEEGDGGDGFAIYRTVVHIASAPTTPSGRQTGSMTARVAEFILSNEPNDPEGSYVGSLPALFLSVASTIHGGPVREHLLTVYEDTIDARNEIARHTFRPGEMYHDIEFDSISLREVVVAAGFSRRIFVVADTNDAGTDQTITVGVYGGWWSDGVARVAGLCTPFEGSTLSY